MSAGESMKMRADALANSIAEAESRQKLRAQRAANREQALHVRDDQSPALGPSLNQFDQLPWVHACCARQANLGHSMLQASRARATHGQGFFLGRVKALCVCERKHAVQHRHWSNR